MFLFNGNYLFDLIRELLEKRPKFHCAFEHKTQLELYVNHSCYETFTSNLFIILPYFEWPWPIIFVY